MHRPLAVSLSHPRPDNDESRTRGIRAFPVVPVAVLLAALAALYGLIFRDMLVQWWEDPNYSHGFVVPMFSGYVLWAKRESLRSLEPRGHPLGFILLLFGVAV